MSDDTALSDGAALSDAAALSDGAAPSDDTAPTDGEGPGDGPGRGTVRWWRDRSVVVPFAVLAAPMLVWLAALWPAVMTNDSVAQAQQALGLEPVVNWHPPFYTALLGVSLRLEDSPWLLALAQVLAMAWAVRRLLAVAVDLGARPAAVYGFGAAVCALPPVGAFACHIWKDVPYAVGMLVVVEWVLRAVLHRTGDLDAGTDAARRDALRLGAAVAVVLLVRQNGYLMVLPTLLAAVVVRPADRWRVGAALAGAATVFVVVTRVVYPAVDVAAPPAALRLGPPLYDLVSVLQQDPGAVDPEVAAAMGELVPVDRLRRQFNCHWQGEPVVREFFDIGRISAWSAERVRRVRAEWKDVLPSSLPTVLGSHLCAAGPAWNPWPAPEELASHETVYWSVVPNSAGIAADPLADRLGARAVSFLQSASTDRTLYVLLWRSAVWVWALTLAVLAVAVRRRNAWYLAWLVPFAMQAGSVVAIYGPHWRYTAGSWIAAVCCLPAAVRLVLRRRL